jgi:hypothetical protein
MKVERYNIFPQLPGPESNSYTLWIIVHLFSSAALVTSTIFISEHGRNPPSGDKDFKTLFRLFAGIVFLNCYNLSNLSYSAAIIINTIILMMLERFSKESAGLFNALLFSPSYLLFALVIYKHVWLVAPMDGYWIWAMLSPMLIAIIAFL